MPAEHRNIALLIDADNANAASLGKVLKELEAVGEVTIRRAYANWANPKRSDWIGVAAHHGIDAQHQYNVAHGKNATDMKMTIDAMDLLLRGRISGFAIMSSDVDFTPLARRIREDGVPVYGFGKSSTPDAFKKSCTTFSSTEVPGKSKVGAPSKTITQAAGAELFALVDAAYSKVTPKGDALVTLSELGKHLKPKSYGFSTLVKMVRGCPEFTLTKTGSNDCIMRARPVESQE